MMTSRAVAVTRMRIPLSRAFGMRAGGLILAAADLLGRVAAVRVPPGSRERAQEHEDQEEPHYRMLPHGHRLTCIPDARGGVNSETEYRVG